MEDCKNTLISESDTEVRGRLTKWCRVHLGSRMAVMDERKSIYLNEKDRQCMADCRKRIVQCASVR